MSRRAIAAACLVLALGLGSGVAGCGDGGGKRGASRPATTPAAPASAAEVARYRSEVTRITRTFTDAAQRFRAAVGPTSGPQDVATALAAFQAAVRSAADQLGRLRPPPGLAAAQGQLADALRAIATACQPTIDAGRAGDAKRMRAALKDFQTKLNGPLGARTQEAATRLDAALSRTR